jgi:hypothetical protein
MVAEADDGSVPARVTDDVNQLVVMSIEHGDVGDNPVTDEGVRVLRKVLHHCSHSTRRYPDPPAATGPPPPPEFGAPAMANIPPPSVAVPL